MASQRHMTYAMPMGIDSRDEGAGPQRNGAMRRATRKTVSLKNNPFEYFPKSIPDVGWVYSVRIPDGIQDDKELFQIFAKALMLPSDFGLNWGALKDCLDDLSWIRLKLGGDVMLHVKIWHEDIPLSSRPSMAATYLNVLRSNILHNKQEVRYREPNILLHVAFPETVRNRVELLL